MPLTEMIAELRRLLPRSRRPVGGVGSLVLVASLAGCFEQAVVPTDEANDRILITNDEFELERRIEYFDEEVVIDPPTTPMVATATG